METTNNPVLFGWDALVTIVLYLFSMIFIGWLARRKRRNNNLTDFYLAGRSLGVVALFLTILSNKKNRKKMSEKLEELTIVNELSLTIGLIMLTIGNFLGGMWANESWGRYWGWDPKETWALISIIIYAAVLHLRIVPTLKGKWLFNLMSIIAFASIMMTYFGVNFYLTGLHSYASGEKVITPTFVYYSLIFITILALISYFANKKNKVL